MSARGIGTEVDMEKAGICYQHAAQAGMLDAINNLGLCYEHGDGVELDQKKVVTNC